MISLNKLSIYFLGFLLIAEQLLFSELYSILIYVSILVVIFINRNVYTDKFQKTIIGLLSSIILISFLNYFFDYRVIDYSISLRDVVKDIWYFSRPVFLLIIGYNIGRKSQPEELFKVIFVVGILSALIHYFQLIQFGSFDFLAGRKSSELSGSSLIEALLFSILFLRVFRKKGDFLNHSLLNKRGFLIALLFFITPSVVLYLSRTMIVVILALLFFGFELYKINTKSLAIASVALVMVASVFMMQSSNFFIYKIQRSVSEVGIGVNNYDELLDENSINDVWRGYEAYRAATQIFANNYFVWLWGEGLGSKVDLKIYQKLGNQEFRFIPKIHNGYAMVFFKSGIIGLLLYLYLMYKLIFGIDRRSFLPIQSRDFLVKLAQGIGLSILLVSVVISGIYNKGDVGRILLLYGAILGSLKYDGPYLLTLLRLNDNI